VTDAMKILIWCADFGREMTATGAEADQLKAILGVTSAELEQGVTVQLTPALCDAR
jgi:hypothetical protein